MVAGSEREALVTLARCTAVACSMLVLGCGRLGYDAHAGRDAALADGNTADLGGDAGADAGLDDAGSMDAGDGGVEQDAGTDAGTDAGADAGMDAGADDAGVDAGTDAGMDGGVDAGSDLGVFVPPVVLTPLMTGAGEDDPTLTGDLLEIYFNRSNEIYRATRAVATDPWSAVGPVAPLNTASSESSPEVASDGLTIYFSSTRGGGALDIWRSTRALRTDVWGAPAVVAELNTGSMDTNPTPRTDGLGLIFSSSRSGSRDIYETTRATVGDAWDPPVPRAELNSTGNDGGPMLARGGTMIVFFSDRGGGAGGSDLYLATRAATGMPFDPPVRIAEVDTAAAEEDPWLSEDGHLLIFTRAGDLYETSR